MNGCRSLGRDGGIVFEGVVRVGGMLEVESGLIWFCVRWSVHSGCRSCDQVRLADVDELRSNVLEGTIRSIIADAFFRFETFG